MSAARNPMVGHLGYARNSLYRIGAHQDRRSAWLTRLGKAGRFIQMKKFPVKGNGLAGPEPPNHLQSFIESAAPFPFGNAKGVKFIFTIALADAEQHFAPGELI